MRFLLSLVTVVLLTACVSAPQGTPSIFGAEPRGHPLDPSDLVVVYASNRWIASNPPEPDDPASKSRRAIEPAKNLEALRKAIVSGFSAVKPGARIALADDRLEAACFTSSGLAERKPWTEPIRPDFDTPACQAVLAAQRIRYLVSVHGWLTIDSSTELETLGLSVAVSEASHYRFEVATAVFDVSRRQRVCGDGGWQVAEGSRGFGIGVAPYLPVPFALPWIEAIDSRAYWEHAAWQAGARTATCFVAPEGPDAVPDPAAGQVKRARPVFDPYAWPSGSPPPIVVRSAPLEFSPPYVEPPRAHDGRVDCSAKWDSASASSLPKLRRELDDIAAAPRVEGALRAALTGHAVAVTQARWASSAQGRVEELQAAGVWSSAPKVIVADVQVRFGQVNRVRCLLKLVASAEVRVHPVNLPEAATPLFVVWAAVDDVPLEDWTRNPAAAGDALDRLLRQVAADLAARYREKTVGVRTAGES